MKLIGYETGLNLFLNSAVLAKTSLLLSKFQNSEGLLHYQDKNDATDDEVRLVGV